MKVNREGISHLVRSCRCPSRKCPSNQWRKRKTRTRVVKKKTALLGEAKQRGSNREHSIANRNLFLPPSSFLFFPVLVLNFEKGACAIYCNLSRPKNTHTHTHTRMRDLTSLGCLSTRGDHVYIYIYIYT